MIMPVATDEDGRMDVRAGKGKVPQLAQRGNGQPKLHVEQVQKDYAGIYLSFIMSSVRLMPKIRFL